jgi:hypothetical protein
MADSIRGPDLRWIEFPEDVLEARPEPLAARAVLC